MKTPTHHLQIRTLAAAASLALLLAAPLSAATTLDHADPVRYKAHVKTLADPALEGRGAGTKGLVKARDYINAEFERLGLKPGAGPHSYFQSLTVTTGAELGPGNRLRVERNGEKTTLGIRQDYVPISFSSNGEASGEVVFAGYGATADEFDYDDYVHLPVKDKIVILLRKEPPSFTKEQDGPPTRHAHLIAKAINARDRGAKAVILVNGKPEENAEDLLIKFGSVSGPDDAGILIAQAKNKVVDGWLKAAGKSLAAVQEQIDKTDKPQSFTLPETRKLSLVVDIERKRATVDNVLGYLPRETDEYVILGAHYDHLGYGDHSSLAPSKIGQVHPGADDNASGTAGLLELARIFTDRPGKLKRGILFMAFTAEEIGLLGSSYWVDHPTRPLDKAVAMINMDMIGRIRDHKIYLGGIGTGSSLEEIVNGVKADYDFTIDAARSGYSASDHTSFVGRDIPVLFFFSGLHGDYHKPSDTWDKIDAESAATLVDIVAGVADRLAETDKRPQYVKVEPEQGSHPAAGSGGRGYGAWFGSVPDFGEIKEGVKFADIRSGSPAEKAGLVAGDILVQWNDKPIKNLYDFTYALRAGKIGQTVTVKVLRNGKPITADVTLAQRK